VGNSLCDALAISKGGGDMRILVAMRLDVCQNCWL
jgi:hypothetical protein